MDSNRIIFCMRKPTLAILTIVLSLTISCILSANAQSSNDAIAEARNKLIEEFMTLMSTAPADAQELESKLAANMKDVRACLLNTPRFKDDPTPITSFIRSVSKTILNQEENIDSFSIFTLNRQKSNNNNETHQNEDTLIVIVNLNKDSIESPLLIVFFNFAPESSQLIVSPVFIKSSTTFSLYDLALRERDSTQ